MIDRAWRDAGYALLAVAVVELVIGLVTGSWAGLWFLVGFAIATPAFVRVRRHRRRGD